MQPSTPNRPVSGTFFEVVRVLRPHSMVRPISAPAPVRYSRHPVTPDIDQCSVPSGTTIVERSESPHLYTRRRQYEVATSRMLGSLSRLNTDVPRTPDSTSSTSCPLSAKSMVTRAKELLSPRWSKIPKTPEGEKVYGAFCRTKSVLKSLRRGSKKVVVGQNSWDSLRSEYYSASEERLDITETFTTFDEPPQIAPLRPVSKFLPDLTIVIPDNKIDGEFVIEHISIKKTEEITSSENDSLYAAPLRLRSSTVTSASKENSDTGETSVYTTGETSFYYAPAAKEDDEVFTASNETSQTERPMTNFMAKLQDAMDSDSGYKNPLITPTTGSIGSPVGIPSSSPKLRHTTLQSQRMKQSGSLRTQFAKAEPATPNMSVPKMWQFNHKESTRDVRVAPSLEKSLHADNLKVFKEDAIAEAAAIVHVKPDVVYIRRSQTLEELESRDLSVSDRQQSDRDMEVAPLNIVPKARPVRSPSGIGPDYDISTMPVAILHTIVFSAAYGDAKCAELASGLYKVLTESGSSITECEWDGRKQRLLLQSHLLEELKILTQYGFMRDDVLVVIRGQIFPTGTTQTLSNENFTNYIRRAVSGYKLAEERAEEILGLAIAEEDEEFMQTSPEDEMFFQRESFDPQGFVYDASSSDEHYERLGSLPSTVGTFEEPVPEPEPRSYWRSSFLWKAAQVFRFDRWKRMS